MNTSSAPAASAGSVSGRNTLRKIVRAGAPIEAATVATDNGSPDEGCSWLANDPAGGPRTLSFTIFRLKVLQERGAPTSGKAFYDDEAAALRAKYTRVGALDQIGDEGLMGVGDSATPSRFGAEIVVIKDGDVLSMRIDGEDPAAFEALARVAAQAM